MGRSAAACVRGVVVLSALFARAPVAAKVLTEKYVAVRIGDTVCKATDHGAKGDGVSDDARSIQMAINHCGRAPHAVEFEWREWRGV